MHLIRLAALGFSAAVLLLSSGTQQSPSSKDDDEATVKASIEKTLNDQVAAWNQGSIRDFMNGYVRDEQLRFASGGNIRRGWEETLNRYLASYSTKEKMGTLKFTDLEIIVLSPDYAEVFGKFHLSRDKSVGDASGLFTLLMRKDGDQWLVLHDHTSSAD